MAIFVHEVRYPAWIQALVDEVVLPAVLPQTFIGELGYRFWVPESQEDGATWLIHVYPMPIELRGQQYDGQRATSGFSLDVGKIVARFDRLDDMAWCSPPFTNAAVVPPRMDFTGMFLGNPVELRITAIAPPDANPTHVMDVQTGKISKYPTE